MANPLNFDIYFPLGDTFEYSFALFSDAAGTVPMVLDGLTGKLQARWSASSPIIQLELDTNNGIIFESLSIGNSVANVVTISISSSVSATLTPDAPMVYSFEITDAGGNRNTYLEGIFQANGVATI